MKTITWKIMIDGNKIATMEAVQGLDKDTPETHMLLIGALENLKQLHLNKMSVRDKFELTGKKDEVKEVDEEDL